jgi:hypothetical protein
MTPWTRDELNKIGAAEELKIAPLRPDGTLGNPVTIWVVCVGSDLYVRSAYGHSAAWFRSSQKRREARIWASDLEKDVVFLDVAPDLNDDIDAAYRTKYHRHGATYVNMMVSAAARSATIKLAARSG